MGGHPFVVELLGIQCASAASYSTGSRNNINDPLAGHFPVPAEPIRGALVGARAPDLVGAN